MSLLLLFTLLAASPKFITYEQFGAVGDGVTNDMQAIAAAHEAANNSGRPVKSAEGKTYYLGNKAKTVRIMTDTDWGTSRFIIDDVGLDKINSSVFVVSSREKSVKLSGIESLRKGQTSLGTKLPAKSLVEVKNDDRKIFIRKGSNANKGTGQKEMLLVNQDGTISADTPVTWDYDHITSIVAYPIDDRPLTIQGGIFITKANDAHTTSYYNRNIIISRSNVSIVGLKHIIEGEGESGAPYHGFLTIQRCCDIVLDSLVLSGHKTYYKKGSLGKQVSMGSYDISISGACNVTFRNCTQITDILDASKWGVMGSNHCRNLAFENCCLSRFDAHQGVYNVLLRNCTFGKIGAVGFGSFEIENCTIHSKNLMQFRGDYGSFWDGTISVRNTRMIVPGTEKEVILFSGYNTGDHDFGYECRLPGLITVKGLEIDDSAIRDEKYTGPRVFSLFEQKKGLSETFPMQPAGSVSFRALKIKSGKRIVLSDNMDFFKDTKLTLIPEISWSVMHPTVLDTVYMRKLTDYCKSREMDSFEICGACGAFTEGSIDGLLYFEDYPLGAAAQNTDMVRHNRESLNAIVRMAHEAGKPVYYWHREVLCNDGLIKSIPGLLNSEGEFDLLGKAYEEFIRYKIRKCFEAVPELDGLVLTLTEASASTIHNSQPDLYPPEKVVEKISRIFAEELESRGKQLIVRSFGSIEQDYSSIEEGLKLLARGHSFEIETKVTPYDFSPFMPDNKFLHPAQGCTISSECDALGEFLGAGRMPSECIEDIVRYVRYSKQIGVDRMTLRLDRWGKNVFDSYPINLYAYEQAILNPDITADQIRKSYYGQISNNKKIVSELIKMSEDGRDCAYGSLFVNGSLIFHQFPTKPVLHYLKAGGIFSLFSSRQDLSFKKEQWGIASDRAVPSRAEIIKAKESAWMIARNNLAKLSKIKKKLPSGEYERLMSLWSYAENEAKGNLELCKVIAAYFDSMEAKDSSALENAVRILHKELDGRTLNRPVDQIADLLLKDYRLESEMRKGECLDFVIPAGVFDDVRGERYMHGASTVYEDGRMYLKIGNPIFPNAYYKTELAGCDSPVSIRFSGKGRAKVMIDGKTYTLDLYSTPSVQIGASERYTISVSKAEGFDYPLLSKIYSEK